MVLSFSPLSVLLWKLPLLLSPASNNVDFKDKFLFVCLFLLQLTKIRLHTSATILTKVVLYVNTGGIHCFDRVLEGLLLGFVLGVNRTQRKQVFLIFFHLD